MEEKHGTAAASLKLIDAHYMFNAISGCEDIKWAFCAMRSHWEMHVNEYS